MMLKQATSVQLPARSARKAVITRSAQDVPQTKAKLTVPEWAAPAKPAIDFFNAEDVTLQSVLAPVLSSDLYTKYAKEVVESTVAQDSYGWKKLPEVINGRAAMLGFLAGALAEVATGESVLRQFAGAPLPVVITLAVIAAGSITPVFLGTKYEYNESLQDIYALPEGWFTEANEKVHGRIAMLGLFSLIAIELFLGHALL